MFHPVPRVDRWEPLMALGIGALIAAAIAITALGGPHETRQIRRTGGVSPAIHVDGAPPANPEGGQGSVRNDER